MARSAGKKQSKGTAPATPAKVTPAITSPSIPKPFVQAPASLRPFFSTLPTDHVYAVHTDSTPVGLKKRVYVIPILLNIVIAAVLAVRVYYAAPVYLDQIITIFGYDTAWKVKPASMGWGDLTNTITNRTGLIMMDYALFGLLGSWPWEFVVGSKYSRRTSAFDWRWNLGFQGREIIVRKGRKWDAKLFSEEAKSWTREDELLIKVKAEAGLRKAYTSKTGYLLLDKDWDLDFRGMIDAHRLVDTSRIDVKDLDHIVLVNYQKQWLLWRVHEEVEFITADGEEDITLSDFKDKLTAIGCEDVFYRWIEIVQYETSRSGGFTPARQEEALKELRRLIEGKGIRYARFWDEIGGQSGIPGLAVAG